MKQTYLQFLLLRLFFFSVAKTSMLRLHGSATSHESPPAWMLSFRGRFFNPHQFPVKLADSSVPSSESVWFC